MYVLGGIPHDRVCASPQTIVQTAICHHSKILCLIDDHMTGLPHRISFLDPLVNIGKRCKIVYIKRSFWYIYFFPGNCLHL